MVFEKNEKAHGSAGEVEFEIGGNLTEGEKVIQEPSQEEPKPEKQETAERVIEYEDNFAVDSEAATAFGKKVKEAVAEQDIDTLADLASYTGDGPNILCGVVNGKLAIQGINY